MKASIFLCFAAYLFIGFIAGGTHASPGECGLNFLNLPSGAYSASTGQANFAGIAGPEAIFSNAGMIGNRLGAFGCHQELLLDTHLETVAAIVPVGRGFSAGMGLTFFDPGKIEGYSADNLKTGDLASGDRLIKFAISKSSKISWGIAVSFYHQRLADEIGDGIGFGGGTAFDFSRGRLAFSCDNLGPAFTIGKAKSPLPQRYAVSAWIPFYHNSLDLNFDLIWSRERGLGESVGLEYNIVGGLDLRAGYSESNLFSLGCGLSAGMATIDYSFIPQGLWGDRHLISVTIAK